MFAYNRKYVVMSTGIALIVTAVVQTVYSAATGLPLAGTLPGLLISLGLFVVVTVGAIVYFSRKANMDVDQLLALYNEACDPRAFIEQSQPYASSMVAPYDAPSAWFMSYYAQALLDLGEVKKAQEIEQGMYAGVKETNKADTQAKIVVNLVPLVQKLLGPADTVPIINEGLRLLEGNASQDARDLRAYLENQLVLTEAMVQADDEKLVRFYVSARENTVVPLRLRVEQAWDEARIHFENGDTQREIECLEFVVVHGNKLALVKPANDRLIALS